MKKAIVAIYSITFLVIVLISRQGFPSAIFYTYDSLSRLTQISYENSTINTYTYDAAGNRLSLEITKSDSAGDINEDGQIDLTDAILVLQVTGGLEPASTVYKQADVNGDGRIAMEEVIYILQNVSGLRDQ